MEIISFSKAKLSENGKMAEKYYVLLEIDLIFTTINKLSLFFDCIFTDFSRNFSLKVIFFEKPLVFV